MSAKNNILLFFILVVAMLVMPFDKGDPVIQCLANSFSSCCFIYIYIYIYGPPFRLRHLLLVETFPPHHIIKPNNMLKG